jgi:acyl carrier protein
MPEDTVTSGNTTEQKVNAIWQEALEISAIPSNVHFLDLGGDSLSAMLCISRMRTVLNAEFTIEDFFVDYSTVSGFTKIIDETVSPEIGAGSK